jgi:hypothetical protein
MQPRVRNLLRRGAMSKRCAMLRVSHPTKLFNMPSRVRALERAYETMWQRHESGEAPASFVVPAEDD